MAYSVPTLAEKKTKFFENKYFSFLVANQLQTMNYQQNIMISTSRVTDISKAFYAVKSKVGLLKKQINKIRQFLAQADFYTNNIRVVLPNEQIVLALLSVETSGDA